MSRWGWLVALLLLVGAPAHAAAPAGVEEFVIVDGPGLGAVLAVEPDGSVDQGDTQGQVVRTMECPQLHYEGTLDGEPSPDLPCGWGRVALRITFLGTFAEQLGVVRAAFSTGMAAFSNPDDPLALEEARRALAFPLMVRVRRDLVRMLRFAVRSGEFLPEHARQVQRLVNQFVPQSRRAIQLAEAAHNPRLGASIRENAAARGFALTSGLVAQMESVLTPVAIFNDPGP